MTQLTGSYARFVRDLEQRTSTQREYDGAIKEAVARGHISAEAGEALKFESPEVISRALASARKRFMMDEFGINPDDVQPRSTKAEQAVSIPETIPQPTEAETEKTEEPIKVNMIFTADERKALQRLHRNVGW